ncbi:MAG: right-handed parallel beta-helix repeat-containing protein [Lewinellaceae bacterium]|nr:right-handed parallel beta-helix repeat-containing protein [Lewinellaceae bacterium]
MRTLILGTFLCFASTLSATAYYVKQSGNDNLDGTSPETAWLSMQHAADVVQPGDIVLVGDGQYSGFDLRTSGTAQKPITFRADGESVIINQPNGKTNDGINIENADYVILEGFRVHDQPRNGIRLVLANHCTVRNCICTNNYERGIFTGFTDDLLLEHNTCSGSIDEHGIYVSNSSDRAIIRYNTCFNNNASGIQINADATQGGDGISSNPKIYGNILYGNGSAGGAAINLDGVQGAEIFNNLIYENHATGIALFTIDGGGPSTGASIYHNTIVQASDGRWCILLNDGATGATVANNILFNKHSFRGAIAVSRESFPNLRSDYNVVVDAMSDEAGDSQVSLFEWQVLGFDKHSRLAATLDELFVNAAGADYHLSATSKAIDAGDATYANDHDLEGNARPMGLAPDAGCYESAASSSARHLTEIPELIVMQETGIISWQNIPEGSRLHVFDLTGRSWCYLNPIHTGAFTWSVPQASPFYFAYQIQDPQGHVSAGWIRN